MRINRRRELARRVARGACEFQIVEGHFLACADAYAVFKVIYVGVHNGSQKKNIDIRVVLTQLLGIFFYVSQQSFVLFFALRDSWGLRYSLLSEVCSVCCVSRLQS